MLEKFSADPGLQTPQHRPVSIAFGLERIGLIAIKTPVLSCLILFALVVAAIFGIERIKIDNSLSQLFRSNSKEYRQYEAVTKRFPSTEFDVLVVVEGKALLDRTNLEKIRNMVTDLQLVEGTRGLISLFSARQAPAPGKLPAALFPAELPQGADYDKFIETVKSNEIIRGKLLSEDGTLALIVLSLEPSIVGNSGLSKTIGEIRKIMADDLADTGLSKELSGVPVMQLEIRNAVERDGLIYNIAGILAGCLIAIIFFRKVSFMIVAAFPPLLAILLALGGLGWAGFSLNMFLNVMTPLIMVISFSDSMQLTFAARDRLLAGEDRFSAFRNAVLVVGPACVLTHATAGISFIALQFSELRPDPGVWRGRSCGDDHRSARGAVAGAGVWSVIGSQRAGLRGKVQDCRCGRQRAPAFLRVDRRSYGRSSRPFQPDSRDSCGGPWDYLCEP